MDRKLYRFEVKLDPQNPIEKRNIDGIDEIRKLYKLNKRQVLNALIKLYFDCVDSGIEYPLYAGIGCPLHENRPLLHKNKIEAKAADTVEIMPEQGGEEQALKSNNDLSEKSEPDFDISVMEDFDPGLFGHS